MKRIACQDCKGSGSHMVGDKRGYPDYLAKCTTCSGQGDVVPDLCTRWWSQKHWSREKRRATRVKDLESGIRYLEGEISCAPSEIKELKKKIDKINKEAKASQVQLKKLRAKLKEIK